MWYFQIPIKLKSLFCQKYVLNTHSEHTVVCYILNVIRCHILFIVKYCENVVKNKLSFGQELKPPGMRGKQTKKSTIYFEAVHIVQCLVQYFQFITPTKSIVCRSYVYNIDMYLILVIWLLQWIEHNEQRRDLDNIY